MTNNEIIKYIDEILRDVDAILNEDVDVKYVLAFGCLKGSISDLLVKLRMSDCDECSIK